MKVINAWLLVLAGWNLFVACDADGPSTPEATVRDSAGIVIVESQRQGARQATWEVASEPHWVVGELEGADAYLFNRVAGAMEVGGGQVVVANGGTNELRFYDEQGQWTQTLGGEGQGPGEFEYLRALERCHPGGFVAFDLNWQKNAYLMDGTFVEKAVLRAPSGVTPYSLACDDRGYFLILGWGRALSSDGPLLGFYQAHDRLVLSDDQGEVRAELGERLVSERIGTSSGSRPHPAGRATRLAIHDGRLFVGSGETFEVEIWRLDGTLERLVRGPRLTLEVTDSLKQRYMDTQLAQSADEQRRAALRSSIAEWEWPASVPAFTDLRVDETGVVWVKRFKIDPEEAEAWSLLDEERGYLGDVRLPRGQELLSIGSEYLLVLMKDEIDVERVGKLTLHRGDDP